MADANGGERLARIEASLGLLQDAVESMGQLVASGAGQVARGVETPTDMMRVLDGRMAILDERMTILDARMSEILTRLDTHLRDGHGSVA